MVAMISPNGNLLNSCSFIAYPNIVWSEMASKLSLIRIWINIPPRSGKFLIIEWLKGLFISFFKYCFG